MSEIKISVSEVAQEAGATQKEIIQKAQDLGMDLKVNGTVLETDA